MATFMHRLVGLQWVVLCHGIIRQLPQPDRTAINKNQEKLFIINIFFHLNKKISKNFNKIIAKYFNKLLQSAPIHSKQHFAQTHVAHNTIIFIDKLKSFHSNTSSHSTASLKNLPITHPFTKQLFIKKNKQNSIIAPHFSPKNNSRNTINNF